MMRREYTGTAEKAFQKAGEIASKLGFSAIGTEHVLYGLLVSGGTAARVMKENGVKKGEFAELLEIFPGGRSKDEKKQVKAELTPKLEEVIRNADQIAERNDDAKIGSEHLLLAILRQNEIGAIQILEDLKVNIQKMYMELIVTMGADISEAKAEFANSHNMGKRGKKRPSVLAEFSRDLVEYAKEGRLDPVFDRDEEISRVIETLCRRTKNNPCLVGEPGVGKTAVAEGLAIRIAEKKVPEPMLNKRVLSLDLPGMVAGTKYRGEFEERMKRTIQEVMEIGNIILFIDELHTVIGAGGAEGAIDASNILKPALSRGELQIIGATTRDEYRKRVERDAAFERRFQQIVIDEPTVVQTVRMLKGLRPSYESYHKIEISDDALEAAAKLSHRYMNDRYLPDKAIDLMDEAAARFRLRELFQRNEAFSDIEEQLKEIGAEKEAALIKGNMEEVLELHEEEKRLQESYDKEQKKWQKKRKKRGNVLGEQQIAEVVAKWTGIPVQQLAKDEMKRLQKLEQTLHSRVIGQEEAVSAVARAVRRGRIGLKDPKRPIGSFLFLGPTGVGKTELSKALAEAVFGSEKDMIRVDMSEYMEQYSVSKLLGSAPGYVGYEEGGQLSEKVRQKPYSVLLFDEIEKAHPDVFNTLLQVLEDGQLTDSQGHKVDFKNTIIIMTSNAGANRIVAPKTLGFLSSEDAEQDHKRMKEGVMEEVKHVFKPEFLNRIDEMLVFHTLSKEHVYDISKLLLLNLKRRVQEQMDITLQYGKPLIQHIADQGYDKDYGARPLRRVIQNQLEDVMAEEIVSGNIGMGDEVKVTIRGDKIVLISNEK